MNSNGLRDDGRQVSNDNDLCLSPYTIGVDRFWFGIDLFKYNLVPLFLGLFRCLFLFCVKLLLPQRCACKHLQAIDYDNSE